MIVAGLGFRRDCPAGKIIAILREAEALSGMQAEAIAAPAFKAAEPGLLTAAAKLGLKLMLIDSASLDASQSACVTHSQTVAAHTGFTSIAEACALAAAGPNAQLRLPRLAHARATCALAESAAP